MYLLFFLISFIGFSQAPTIAITSNTPKVTDGSTTNDSSIVLIFTISESTANFVLNDITTGNGSLGSFTGSGAYYTAIFTPSGQGACTIDVAANKFTNSGDENNNAASQFNWIFESTSPTVSSLTSTKANGSYKQGEQIPVTVTFSEVVNVTGTPTLTLETGTSDAVVNYSSGTGSNTLTFNYAVASGHTSTDLRYVATSSLVNLVPSSPVSAGTFLNQLDFFESTDDILDISLII